MAIIQGLLAVIARSAGKLLNTVFGWATTLLFGKVSEDRQLYLSVMAFASVAWLVVLIGMIFPDVGTFLLAFVPLPEWVNDNWVRMIMLAAAVLIPLLVGWIALRMLEPEERPAEAAGKAKVILKGYPYTVGLALTLVLMTLFAPFLKLPALARRWETQHVPVEVESHQYAKTLDEVEQALENAGWCFERTQASWMLRLPTRVLTALAGGAIENMVAEEMTTLRTDRLEVTLHPADLVISGKEAEVAHARAVVAQQLAFSPAHMTWTKEANELEDRLEALWRQTRENAASDGRHALEQLRQMEEDLKKVQISYEEWEVLFRQKLLLERSILQSLAGLTDGPHSPESAGPGAGTPPRTENAQAPEGVGTPPRSREEAATSGLRAGVLALAASVAWLWNRRRRRGL